MKKNKGKFIVNLHGASRNYNYGDVLLMAIYKSWIEEAGGEVIMDMANPYYGKYLNVKHSIQIKEAIKKADIIVYGGGGYFGEPRKPSLRWRVKFVLHHLLPGILARIKGKPYGLFGIGFGPLNNWFIRKISMYVVNGAKVVSVRDNESRNYLEKYGYKGSIHINPDSALSIADSQSRYYVEKQSNNERRKIALHIPLDKGEDCERIRPTLLSFLKEISNNLLEFDFCFLVDHGIGENCYQYKFFDSLKDDLKVDWQIKQYTVPEETLYFISTCDTVLTTKLHVAITSYALGVKPIGISKHPKTKRFFKQIGLSTNHFSLYDILEEEKRKQILDLIYENEDISIDSSIIVKAKNNKELISELIK
jgi:polysaccharide pyruvyl transferase WcaK-like protein